jgi:UDP-3-O-[3-hydroxymyristoyl] glucosamine N-acyltransferase
VRGIAPLDRAHAEELSFLSSPKYASLFAASRAGVVLVTPELVESPGVAKARIIVDRPHDALLALIPKFYLAPRAEPGVHPTAVIGRGARLGANVSIGAYAVIGDGARIDDDVVIDAHAVVGVGVAVGAKSHLYPSVTAYSGAVIGQRVIVHAGARVGSDGFGYVFRGGRHEKIPHVGRCIVEDDVEIGANTTIDRGSIDDTVIGAGTKIDNLVHIAHNCRIGRLCLIMAQVGIAGSVRVEDGCIIAGQVGISGHHTIGKGSTLAAQAGVFGDIPPGETWSGYPARPHKEALRAQATLFRLAPLMRQLEKLLNSERAKDE